MTTFTTFYLSRIIGRKVFHQGKYLGTIRDLLIDNENISPEAERPKVSGLKLKSGKSVSFYSFDGFHLEKMNSSFKISCDHLVPLSGSHIENDLYLVGNVLDKQIVDMNGRKLVRVNDVRLVSVAGGTYAIAVDIGIEGLLRRIGVSKQINQLLKLFRSRLPAKFILWEDVEAIDFSNLNIKLSKTYAKLETLHPSDLADIIEDLGKKSSTEVFSALDEEKAADVLEELEVETQVHIIESLPIEKAADVLDKMPADEVADILDELEAEKVELLLNEMEKDTSQEVRELMVYPDRAVGSIMSAEHLAFKETVRVGDVFTALRQLQPEAEALYNLFVTNEKGQLIATFSLRDLVVSDTETCLQEIMKPSPVHLYDYQEIDDVAEFVSKYNMLAIPVVDKEEVLQGMVVIDDVIDDLMDKRRTNK